jgi:glutamine amidotransferase
MCELLGLNFARPVAADFTLSAFALRDEENADGWGMAWYADRSLNVVKEPLSWRKSRYASFLESYSGLVSHIYVAHVRHATVGGEPKHADTHPFQAELAGRNYCFAHNGTVRSAIESMPLGRYHPIGQTDSEHVFCSIMNEIAQRAGNLTAQADWQWLAQRFVKINAMGKFNSLLADGDRLFAYHDMNGFKGLHFHGVRMRGEDVEHLEDAFMEMQVESDAENRGAVIATRPLTDIGWHAFQPGELLVLEDGRIVYSSTRSRDQSACTATSGKHAAKQSTPGAEQTASQR